MYCEIPDFVRCCFCLPLRRGVLTFGYIKFLFCAFMIGVYSVHVDQKNTKVMLLYNGAMSMKVPAEVCIAFYCVEVVLSTVVVYGAHMKHVVCLKVFYYYAITTVVAGIVLQVVEFAMLQHRWIYEMVILTFTGFCIQLYLIMVTRSLVRKLQIADSHVYENQLHLVVSGDRRAPNGVYSNCTTLPSDV